MERLCLDCGCLLKGRADKKFCNDACRSNHHNAAKLIDNNLLNGINYVLRNNRRILKSYETYGNLTIKFADLVQKGFDFDYHTHRSEKNGQTFCFCYEYGYLILENEELLLIKRKEE